MVDYLPRSAWGARAPRSGPGKLTPSRVRGVAIHWPGTTSSKPITSLAAVASALRGWQAFHMDGRGWSDIAYQVAIDQAGRAWILRGLATQSGANGDDSVNEEYGAILLVLVQGEEPSAAMLATARAVVADFRRLFPGANAIVGHGQIRPDGGTDCPGPAARRAIAAGKLTPGAAPAPKPEEDTMTPAQMAELKRYVDQRMQAYSFWLDMRARRAELLAAQAAGNAKVIAKAEELYEEARKAWEADQKAGTT